MESWTSRLRRRGRILAELGGFLLSGRRLWLWPIVAALLLVGAIVYVAFQSPAAPFVYTLF